MHSLPYPVHQKCSRGQVPPRFPARPKEDEVRQARAQTLPGSASPAPPGRLWKATRTAQPRAHGLAKVITNISTAQFLHRRARERGSGWIADPASNTPCVSPSASPGDAATCRARILLSRRGCAARAAVQRHVRDQAAGALPPHARLVLTLDLPHGLKLARVPSAERCN